jgi:hypothetical protein
MKHQVKETWLLEDYYDRFSWLCAVLPQPLDYVYLWETFREGLHLKLKMAILGMLKATIIEIVNLVKTME